MLRQTDWSETSQLVVLLTQNHGKRRGLAKGSQRLSPSAVQRFSGGFELLTLGQVIASARPGAGLATITEWDLQDDHWFLRRDLRAMQVGMYAAEVCDALLAEDDPHPGTYEAMRLLLASLRNHAETDTALLRFHWSVLTDTGYRPELEQDVISGLKLVDQDTYTFDPHHGGLTAQGNGPSWRVRRSTVQALRSISQANAALDAEHATRANRLMAAYLRHLLGRELLTSRSAGMEPTG